MLTFVEFKESITNTIEMLNNQITETYNMKNLDVDFYYEIEKLRYHLIAQIYSYYYYKLPFSYYAIKDQLIPLIEQSPIMLWSILDLIDEFNISEPLIINV